MMTVVAESVEEGIRSAWVVIDPTFDLEPYEVIQEPVTNGTDEAVTIIYDTGNDDDIVITGLRDCHVNLLPAQVTKIGRDQLPVKRNIKKPQT